jgi:hypothetical protein
MKAFRFTSIPGRLVWLLLVICQIARADQTFQNWSEKDLLRTGQSLSVVSSLTGSLHQSTEVDCSKFTSYQQITQYEDSIRTLAKTDISGAIHMLSSQMADLSRSREQLGNDLTRFIRVGDQARNAENLFRGFDNFLGAAPVSGINANIVSDKGWKVPLDIAGRGAGFVGATTEPGTALNMYSNVVSRTLTPEIATGLGSLKALTRVSTYLLSEGMYAPRTIADAKVMETTARIKLLTVQELQLQQLRGELLADKIMQNNMRNVLHTGMGHIETSVLTTVLPNVAKTWDAKTLQSLSVQNFVTPSNQFNSWASDMQKKNAQALQNFSKLSTSSNQFNNWLLDMQKKDTQALQNFSKLSTSSNQFNNWFSSMQKKDAQALQNFSKLSGYRADPYTEKILHQTSASSITKFGNFDVSRFNQMNQNTIPKFEPPKYYTPPIQTYRPPVYYTPAPAYYTQPRIYTPPPRIYTPPPSYRR